MCMYMYIYSTRTPFVLHSHTIRAQSVFAIWIWEVGPDPPALNFRRAFTWDRIRDPHSEIQRLELSGPTVRAPHGQRTNEGSGSRRV